MKLILYDQVKGREKGNASESISEYHKTLRCEIIHFFLAFAERFDQKLVSLESEWIIDLCWDFLFGNIWKIKSKNKISRFQKYFTWCLSFLILSLRFNLESWRQFLELFIWHWGVSIYKRARIHGSKEVTRAKPVGQPDSHPSPLTKEAIPIKRLPPPRWIVSGPPESPLQAPTFPSPDVQTVNIKKWLLNSNKTTIKTYLCYLGWLLGSGHDKPS